VKTTPSFLLQARLYGLAPAAAETQPQQIELLDLEEIIKWLDGLWLDGDLKEYMSEGEYLEFRKAIEESLK